MKRKPPTAKSRGPFQGRGSEAHDAAGEAALGRGRQLARVRRAVQTFLREQPEARAALISYLDAQSARLKGRRRGATP